MQTPYITLLPELEERGLECLQTLQSRRARSCTFSSEDKAPLRWAVQMVEAIRALAILLIEVVEVAVHQIFEDLRMALGIAC